MPYSKTPWTEHLTKNAYKKRIRTAGGLLARRNCRQTDDEIVDDYFACDLPQKRHNHIIISGVLENLIEMIYLHIHAQIK
jgi:hypothetical protein